MSFLYENRLTKFEEAKLGLERNGIVRLSEHNSRWKRIFSDEAYLILHKLNIESLKLYHCGSTAVKGIVAKPIIDIVGSIPSLEDLDQKQELLEEIGYEYKGEYGIKGRRYSVLYNTSKTKGFCHLHIFKDESKELLDHLNFRDSLRINNDAAKKYEDHKRSLRVSRREYSEAKSEMIAELLSDLRPYYYPRKRAKNLIILGASEGHQNTLSYVEGLYCNNDAEIIDLQNYTISPFKYGMKEQGDDFIFLINKMIDADRVVFATPIYWYSMSGAMKDFIDRLSDLLSGPYQNLGENLYGKKIDLISTGSNLEMPNGFSTVFNLTATYFGMDFMSVSYKSV